MCKKTIWKESTQHKWVETKVFKVRLRFFLKIIHWTHSFKVSMKFKRHIDSVCICGAKKTFKMKFLLVFGLLQAKFSSVLRFDCILVYHKWHVLQCVNFFLCVSGFSWYWCRQAPPDVTESRIQHNRFSNYLLFWVCTVSTLLWFYILSMYFEHFALVFHFENVLWALCFGFKFWVLWALCFGFSFGHFCLGITF